MLVLEVVISIATTARASIVPLRFIPALRASDQLSRSFELGSNSTCDHPARASARLCKRPAGDDESSYRLQRE